MRINSSGDDGHSDRSIGIPTWLTLRKVRYRCAEISDRADFPAEFF